MDDEFDEGEMKLYEELYNLTGAKIRFECDGCVQEGIIHYIVPEAKRVALNRVYFIYPDKKPVFSGLLKYRFEELKNYEVVATAKEVNPYPVNEYIAKLLYEKLYEFDDGKKKYSINQLFFDGMLSEESDEEEVEVEEIEEEFELKVPTHLENTVPYDSVILDTFDLEWKQAVRHIGQQEVIGVSFHGKVSRLGELIWVCISTSYCVFLFDIKKLGIDAFNNGLRSIFQDLTIKKVIHDCRFPSDCLFHKFETKLANVFDTLVADFVATKQVYNDKYNYVYVQSLNSCLRIHLEILPEFTYVHDKYLKKNDVVNYFSKRPVSNALRYVLIKDTIYLLLLHKTLAKKLLAPLYTNVNRYLNVITTASQVVLDTVGDEISSPDSIPPTILMHGIQTVKFQKPVKKSAISLECKFQHPLTGKLIGVKKYSCSDDVNSGHSSNDNCVEKIIEENHNTMQTDRQQKSPVLKGSEKHSGSESDPSEKKSLTVDRIIVRPSARHIDEVYHKLVNNQRFRAQNSESVINVKPPEKYVSKFTMRIPPECVAFTENALTDSVTDFYGNYESSDSTKHFPDYSETWAKLRAEVEAESCNVSQNSNSKSTNIQFVPAGKF